jgi:RNA polymerase sigma factor (sigma-70 family)
MATNGTVLRQIRTLYNVGAIRDLGDGQLLERFTTDRGESAELAFAVLVERHGPMVLRICKSVLSDSHDTEDAFQATFLVLVKKARGLWVRDSLGPWLHRVAFRTASSVRSGASRRRRLQGQLEEVVLALEPVDLAADVGQVLHEEIERLPERFRAAVVLCDLESRTHQQAARHLGWPIGTVKSRLARGRDRLRERLARRGLGPDSAFILAAAGVDDGLIALKLPALIDSTSRLAGGLTSSKTIAASSTAALTAATLRTMFVARWLKVATLAIAVGAVGSGAGVLATLAASARQQGKAEKAAAEEPPSTTVRPGKLHAVVSESGIVSTENSWSVINSVEGRSTISWILPDKSIVKKGDLVCQLDPRELKVQLEKQSIIVNAAKAAYENARLTREVAEIAVVEYTEGILVQDRQTIQLEIDIANAAVAKAEARLARMQRARDRIRDAIDSNKNAATPDDILAELEIEGLLEADLEHFVEKKAVRNQVKGKMDRLEEMTKPITIKDLKAEVERTRADELAKLATLNYEKAKKEKLERQLKNCNLYAPADGVIVHANDTRFHNRVPAIANDATVRERQIIFTMQNLKSPLRVVTRVPAWSIARVKPGAHVRLKVDGIADRVLRGTVSDVAPLPDPMGFYETRKVYTTWVRFDDPPAALVLDMPVAVEIDVADLENVVTVPTRAVLAFDGKDHLAVQKPDGFEWREVTLGMANADSVEVKKGLSAGEQVILEPAKLRTGRKKGSN